MKAGIRTVNEVRASLDPLQGGDKLATADRNHCRKIKTLHAKKRTVRHRRTNSIAAFDQTHYTFRHNAVLRPRRC
jgi:hypothetical protein